MDGSFAVPPIESLTGEAPLHGEDAAPRTNWSLDGIKSRVSRSNVTVLSRLVDAFSIPESGIGLAALANELRIDVTMLHRARSLPPWVADLLELLGALAAMPGATPARDLAVLRSQPKYPLRDFLAPGKAGLPPIQQRALRAVRGLLALRLISANERLTAPLATELARWLQARTPTFEGPEDITVERLREQRSALPADSPHAKLLTVLIEAQEASLPNPFTVALATPLVPAPPDSTLVTAAEHCGSQEEPSSAGNDPDPLRSFKAAAGTAGSRIFSGTPDLWRYLQPFELEAVIPRVMAAWREGQSEEALATMITLFSRVMPYAFSRLPLSLNDGAGLWIDPEGGYVVWNLDEIIARRTAERPFVRTPNDRYVRVPLPVEVAAEILRRKRNAPLASTVAGLFQNLDGLHKRTKQVLRRCSLTSHRPTLTRLAASWGRYVLSHCRDEGYAAAIGVDFTLGTSANFNYLRLRGRRIWTIVSACYAAIGLSGQCAGADICDVGSQRLPSLSDAGAYVRRAFLDVQDTIAGLPRNCATEQLLAAHNNVATAFYAAFKLLTAGRSLSEETVTRTRLCRDRGVVMLIDKRVAAYHERRPSTLPPTMRRWLGAYLSWLHLVAYRLGAVAPSLAQAIRSVADGKTSRDRHPLFFRFRLPDVTTEPIGAADIEQRLAECSLEPNAGRHLMDALFRDASLDSAAVMAWSGRGNPGQEAYGSGSAIVPQLLLAQCASVIEDWLGTLDLPPSPDLSPRRLDEMPLDARRPIYVPSLLTMEPPSVRIPGGEPCPFRDETAAMSGLFVELLRAWRSKPPPPSWAGVALSLILEDGVFLADELEAALSDSEHRMLYVHDERPFLDTRCSALGIRRIWLSAVSVRLLYRIPVPAERFSGLETIAAAAQELIHAAHGPATNDPVQFVLDCTRAYLALNTPGLLFAWMAGTAFSRTARPEVIARALLGRCEHPKFDLRARMQRRRVTDDVSKALRQACNAVDAGRSHRAALHDFAESLAQMDGYVDPGTAEHLIVGYCLYLANTQRNIVTVERYLSACRPFLNEVSASAAENGLANLDWRALVSRSLNEGDDGDASSPLAAAINHCLTWLGIDVRLGRRAGPPPSAFRYADRLTSREVESALSVLAARRRAPGDDWHRAEAALQLMRDCAVRWDEVACLRICDLSLSSKTPHVVITDESEAHLKSQNAPRVLRLASRDAVNALHSLCAARAAQYPGDGLVPLFGDDRDTRRNTSADRIHDLISDALWRATGSALISLHNSRHTVITRELHAILDLSLHDRGSPLQLRQAVFGLSVRAGHGHHSVTVGEYAEDLDWARRKWMDAIHVSLNCAPRPAFLEIVTGIPAATYRKRASRCPTDTPDLYEGFKPDKRQPLGLTVRLLSSLVDPDLYALEWPDEEVQVARLTAAGTYVGLRLLGEDEEAASLTARLTDHEASRLESSLGMLQRSRPVALTARKALSREGFVEAMLSSHLPAALSSLSPSSQALRCFTGAVKAVGAPWEFTDVEAPLDLGPLAPALAAVGIAAQVVLRASGRSALDDLRISRLANAGLPRARLIRRRHFPRNVQCIVRFVAVQDVPNTKPRASRQHALLVSASVIALHLLKDAKHDQPITR